MQIDGAIITEENIQIAIVSVKPILFNKPAEKEVFREKCQSVFPSLPVILMTQNPRGMQMYVGQQDIVKLLNKKSYRRIPFQKYTID